MFRSYGTLFKPTLNGLKSVATKQVVPTKLCRQEQAGWCHLADKTFNLFEQNNIFAAPKNQKNELDSFNYCRII
jgi:hypothetical protein